MPTDQDGAPVTQVNEERMEKVAEQADAISDLASGLVEAGVRKTAREAGRTPEEQWDRMGDHFEYQAVEMDPNQVQLDDYEVSGETVEVRR